MELDPALHPMLAFDWHRDDPAGWWMSEKFDGVRCLWDGREFWARSGRRFAAADSIKAMMPSTPMDGELFYDREIRAKPHNHDWRTLTFQAFDLPASEAAVEDRVRELEGLRGAENDFLRIVDHVRCDGLAHLEAFAAAIFAKGGEGVMIRRPGSIYVHGRSEDILKVKRRHLASSALCLRSTARAAG